MINDQLLREIINRVHHEQIIAKPDGFFCGFDINKAVLEIIKMDERFHAPGVLEVIDTLVKNQVERHAEYHATEVKMLFEANVVHYAEVERCDERKAFTIITMYQHIDKPTYTDGTDEADTQTTSEPTAQE